MPKQKIKKEKPTEEDESPTEENDSPNKKDDSPQSKVHRVSAKRTHVLNQYNRTSIYKILTEDGSGPNVCNFIAKKYKQIDKRSMENFVNRHAENSQKYVGEEANSLEFNSLDNWVSHFKSMEYNVNCGNELPLVLKALAETESPESSKRAVNIKKLYEWLSDVMMGHAPKPLNVLSEIFLMENFKELMEKLNSPESEEELRVMEKALAEKANVIEFSESGKISEVTFAKSLNPLELNIPEDK